MQSSTHSSTRRAFLKLIGAASSFVLLVKCKTVGVAATLKDDDPATGDFVSLSKTLTGFDDLDPALAAQFLADLKAQHGDGPVQSLIATYKTLELEGGDLEAAVQAQIMEAEALTGVAGATMLLWYTGSFAKIEVAQPIAINAYKKGFVWQCFDGKPMGVPGDDLGDWSEPPAA